MLGAGRGMLCADVESREGEHVTAPCWVCRAALALLLLSCSIGCQSTRSWQQGCPGIYSGVRYYYEQIGELPYDGRIFFNREEQARVSDLCIQDKP